MQKPDFPLRVFLEKHGLAHLVERFEEDGLSSVTDLFAAIQLRDIDFAEHFNIKRGHLQKLTRVLEEEAAKITARGPVSYRCKKVVDTDYNVVSVRNPLMD